MTNVRGMTASDCVEYVLLILSLWESKVHFDHEPYTLQPIHPQPYTP